MTPRLPRNNVARGVLIALALAIAGTVLLRLAVPKSDPGEGGEAPAPSAIKVSTTNGETRLLVPQAALGASGIRVTTLRATTVVPGVGGFATALQPQPLLEQRRAIVAATAELERAQSAAAAAAAQSARLNTLYADQAIVSKREAEAGAVAAASERANVELTRSQLALLKASAARQWGPVIARWLIEGSPSLDSIASGSELLLQVAPKRDLGVVDPKTVRLDLGDGETSARIISPAPQADPQFQTRTFYAFVAANARLLPGMTVSARFATGDPVRGVTVPSAAIVRWKGNTFVYVIDGTNRYIRQPVSIDFPAPEGWIDPKLSPGTQIVVEGAQLLLSQELGVTGSSGAAQ